MLSLQATTVTNLLYSIPSWVQADVLICFFMVLTPKPTSVESIMKATMEIMITLCHVNNGTGQL